MIIKDLVIHSELGASSYSRWKECPGSVSLCRNVPKKTSIYAEEGTIAHNLAAFLLDPDKNECPEYSDEMREAVNVYVEYVESLRKWAPNFEAVEQKLDLTAYHPKLFGTADYVCYFSQEKILEVVDYKHGAGVAVDVRENEQLMYYGLGALHGNGFPIETIILTIVQPRCYHEDGPIRSWQTTPIAMLEYIAQLIDDAKATEAENAPLKTGDHCRWCNAQGICPEMHKKAIVTAQDVFGQTVHYDPAKLSDTLKKLDQIEAWAKSVRSFAYNEAEAGRIPPGFKLVDKRAMRKWKDNVDLGILSRKFPDVEATDLIKPQEIKSPAQVEKLLDKSAKAVLEELTIKESSGKNLVEIADSRPEIVSKIKDVFEIIET